jgi:hypothetical protein
MTVYIVIGIIFLCLGVLIGVKFSNSYTVFGTLVVDESNPELESYRIEIDNLDDILKKKKVILKVFNPHK